MVRLRMKRVLFMPYCLVQTQSDISFHISYLKYVDGLVGISSSIEKEYLKFDVIEN